MSLPIVRLIIKLDAMLVYKIMLFDNLRAMLGAHNGFVCLLCCCKVCISHTTFDARMLFATTALRSPYLTIEVKMIGHCIWRVLETSW